MKSLKQYSAKSATWMFVLVIAGAISTAHGLPNPGMQIDPERTALVITDPQNDFLSPEGVT